MSSPRATSSISVLNSALRLGVAVETFGRKPFLGRELIPHRAVHALAAFDEGGDHETVDLGQPACTQQRLDRILDRNRARPPDVRQELALPAREGDRGIERRHAHERLAPLGGARPRRGALVDDQAIRLRADQPDAELVAPQGQRIADHAVHPRAAEIDRCADAVVGPGPSADAVTRLEHGDDESRIVQQPRRDQPRHAGAEHDHTLGLAVAHRPGVGARHFSTRAGSLFMSSNRIAPADAIAARSA